MQTKYEIFVFGEFRLDVKERRMWQGDELITLPPKTFDLLVVMVQDAGRLLDKDYLIRSVWPDSYVQDANLSVHVANIRKALGRTADASPFIETIPKAGYRFVAPVLRLPAQNQERRSVELEPTMQIPAHEENASLAKTEKPLLLESSSVLQQVHRKGHRSLLAAISLVMIAAALFFLHRMESAEAHAAYPVTTHPLISTPGLFLQPSFSPDGSELAYTWRADSDVHQSIYVQRVSEDRRTLLIDTGSDDYAPAWSPDASKIAFLHTGTAPQTFDILIVDRHSTAPRRTIAMVCDASDAFHGTPSLAWSPDGKSLVTTDCDKSGKPKLVAVDVRTGSQRQLTDTPAYAVDDQAAYAPDGAWIAFRRSRGDSSDDIYLLSAAGGPARKLTAQSDPIDGLDWDADGKSIILSSALATSQGSIWRLPINGGAPVAVTTPLTHTSSPVVSRAGHRMAYVDSPNNVSVWKLSLSGRQESQPFIASNFFDASPVFSPDGTHVAFRSDRSGANEIWLCRSDGSEPRRITHFNGPMTGSPRWSPDGQSLAFDSRVEGHAEIFVVNLASSEITRETNTAATGSDSVVPNWSADGTSIYFSSNRTGSWQIWRHAIVTGREEQLTNRGGFNAAESADGKFLIYVGDMDQTQIRKRSLVNPQDDVVLVSLGHGLWHSWTLNQKSMLYLRRLPRSASSELIRLDLKSARQETVASLSQAVNDSFSFSPDQRSLLYARRSNTGSNIMIVDGWN